MPHIHLSEFSIEHPESVPSKQRNGLCDDDWIEHLKSRVGPEQRSVAWFAARINRITCSDIAAVIGLNPYSDSERVLRKKLKIESFSGNVATKHGQDNEDNAIACYERVYKKKVIDFDFGLQCHPVHDRIAGSPDGITDDCILIEIKCPLRRKIKPGIMPLYYVPQVLFLLEIFDLKLAHYVEYVPPSRTRCEEIQVIEIRRAPAWVGKQVPKLLQFVERLRQLRKVDYAPAISRWVPKKLECKPKELEYRVYRFVF